MTGPAWYSQPFPPEGASAAEGIRSQLGSPRLDLLTILVRESAQNSWDAKLSEQPEPVHFAIDLWSVHPDRVQMWRDLLGRAAPLNDHLPLRSALGQTTIRVMTVSDRGTSGLGGPTRADDVVGADRDFVSFVRNIGEPRDTEFGGGTYGFGKAIFYLISKPGTVLIHTRCRLGESYETRLIGCALWQSYITQDRDGERRYTGRHWWGDASGDVIEPLIGDEAEEVAHRLGLDPFEANETGTTVVVIDPLLGDFEPAMAAAYLAETIVWHLWPKMLGRPNGMPAMRFSVTCDGVEYHVPDPRETRPLDMFVAAYGHLTDGKARVLECFRPKRVLGRLGLERRVALAVDPTDAAQMAGIGTMVHHVCLLRIPELVVTYHPGPKPPSEYIAYAGVFLADQSLDDMYARAEPPTHDSWNHQSLENPESTFVRTTFQRIKESLDGLLELVGGTRPGAAHIALGAASNKFSSLIGGAWGTGGATAYNKPGEASPIPRSGDSERSESSIEGHRGPDAGLPGASRPGDSDAPTLHGRPTGWPGPSLRPTRSRLRVEYIGDPYLTERSDSAVIVQQFRLPVPGPQRVAANLAVAVTDAGGRETDPPLGADMPNLLGWENAAGDLFTDRAPVLEGGDNSVWHVIILPAPDTMTEITVVAQPVEAAT